MNMDGIEIQRCNACGATIDEQETACPECGRDDCLMYPFEPSPDPRSASRHTPGPWYTGHGQIISLASPHGCTIASCNATSEGIGDAEAEANAALIAAAPEMLEALRHAADKLHGLGEWLKAHAEPEQALSVRTVEEDARDIIRKAGGE
jgi:hypothetical protein